MRVVLLNVFVFVIGILFANGQNRNSLLQRINEIKGQSEMYYWDQYTCPDVDTAKINATKRLLIDVNLNRSENECLTVGDIMPHANYIKIERGNLKQFFVYIKKTDAATIKKGSFPHSVSDNNIPYSYMELDTPPISKAFIPDAFIQRIVETKDFTAIYKLLKSLKAQGQILQFGKLKDVEDYSSFDLILFDMQSQEIVTMLSSTTETGHRINLVNGTIDSLDNYPTDMTAVIWYIKK